MPNDAPSPKSALALLRFEVICHLKALRQQGIPLAECLRAASSRPWPEPDGNYYSPRTIKTWWYDYAKSGYTGLTGPPHPLRHIEDPSRIDPFFYTRTERVVRKDGTVTLDKTLYEVPLSLRALPIELRYDPVLLDRAEVWHKGSFHGLAIKADLHLNSQTYNRSHKFGGSGRGRPGHVARASPPAALNSQVAREDQRPAGSTG